MEAILINSNKKTLHFSVVTDKFSPPIILRNMDLLNDKEFLLRENFSRARISRIEIKSNILKYLFYDESAQFNLDNTTGFLINDNLIVGNAMFENPIKSFHHQLHKNLNTPIIHSTKDFDNVSNFLTELKKAIVWVDGDDVTNKIKSNIKARQDQLNGFIDKLTNTPFNYEDSSFSLQSRVKLFNDFIECVDFNYVNNIYYHFDDVIAILEHELRLAERYIDNKFSFSVLSKKIDELKLIIEHIENIKDNISSVETRNSDSYRKRLDDIDKLIKDKN